MSESRDILYLSYFYYFAYITLLCIFLCRWIYQFYVFAPFSNVINARHFIDGGYNFVMLDNFVCNWSAFERLYKKKFLWTYQVHEDFVITWLRRISGLCNIGLVIYMWFRDWGVKNMVPACQVVKLFEGELLLWGDQFPSWLPVNNLISTEFFTCICV